MGMLGNYAPSIDVAGFTVGKLIRELRLIIIIMMLPVKLVLLGLLEMIFGILPLHTDSNNSISIYDGNEAVSVVGNNPDNAVPSTADSAVG